MTPLFSLSTAAAVLAISSHTLRRLVQAGKIPHRRVGRAIRFCESDLVEYLEACRVGVQEPARPQGRVVAGEMKPMSYYRELQRARRPA
jgi:excisionase family DNA binding protein